MTSPDAKGELQTGRGPQLNGRGMTIGIVCSRFNDVLVRELLDICYGQLSALKVTDTEEHWVPGSFELPIAAQALAASGRFDAVIVLGAVIRGETTHYELVSEQSAAGVMQAQLTTGVPIVFGVVTTENVEQARARLKNGAEYASAAVEMVQVLRAIG